MTKKQLREQELRDYLRPVIVSMNKELEQLKKAHNLIQAFIESRDLGDELLSFETGVRYFNELTTNSD